MLYLHLGQDTVIRTCDLVGIFDLENSTVSQITRRTLANAEKNGRVINVSSELPKSFVVCSDGGQPPLYYLSQLSPATLLKRTKEALL